MCLIERSGKNKISGAQRSAAEIFALFSIVLHVSNFLFCFLKSDRIFSPNWPMGLFGKMLVLLAFLFHERQSDTLPNKHSFAAIRNFLFVPFSFSCSFRLGPCPCPFFRERQFERKTTTKIPFSILLLLLLSLLTAEKEAENSLRDSFEALECLKRI